MKLLCSLFYLFYFFNLVTLEYKKGGGFTHDVAYGPGSTFDNINEVFLKLDKTKRIFKINSDIAVYISEIFVIIYWRFDYIF